jgi:hypothetical protein
MKSGSGLLISGQRGGSCLNPFTPSHIIAGMQKGGRGK